ncbi:MAG: ABC transporter permease [Pseudobdellovibrionaceae bacterium]
MKRLFLKTSLVFCFTWPYFFLIYKLGLTFSIDNEEFLWALKNTLIQSLGSAFFTLFIALFCVWGLVGLSSKKRKWLEKICFSVSFVPSLFIMLAALQVVDPFPMGLAGIVLIHVWMNIGLVTIFLARYIEDQWAPYLDWAYIYQVSRFKYILKVILPLSRKYILSLFVFVFSISFISFAIPLVVGGSQGTTIEVLIYEKIRIQGKWSEALTLSLIQSLITVVFIFFRKNSFSPKNLKISVQSARYFHSTTALLVILFIHVVLFYGYMKGIWLGLGHWRFFINDGYYLLQQLLGSWLVGLGSGVLTIVTFIVFAWFYKSRFLDLFLKIYLPPTTAVCGFAFLIATPNNSSLLVLSRIILALVLTNIVFLYRLGWSDHIAQLKLQAQSAEFLGASPTMIFLHILCPQVLPQIGRLAGLMAAWSLGDFALSRILVNSDLTLALTIETLLSSYRLHSASLLSFFLLVSGLLIFLIFSWGGHVLGQKLKASLSGF